MGCLSICIQPNYPLVLSWPLLDLVQISPFIGDEGNWIVQAVEQRLVLMFIHLLSAQSKKSGPLIHSFYQTLMRLNKLATQIMLFQNFTSLTLSLCTKFCIFHGNKYSRFRRRHMLSSTNLCDRLKRSTWCQVLLPYVYPKSIRRLFEAKSQL